MSLSVGLPVTAAAQEPPPLRQETAEAPSPPLLTLASAVEQALTRNDRLVNAQDSLEQANLGVRLARSYFRPKVIPNVLGSFGQTDVSNQTYRLDVTQRLTTGTELRATVGSTSDKNQLGTFYSTDTTLQLSQPVLRGFGRTVARRGLTSAEARAASATRDQAIAEQQVAIEVASAYYRIVGQQLLVDVYQKTLDRSKGLLEASKAKLEIGKVSQLDVFRAQQLVAQAEGQFLDAQGAVEDAKDQLRSLLGHGPEYEFEVEPEIPVVSEEVGAEQAIETALSRRLELRTAQEGLSEAERSVSYNKNQLLPQFDLNLALTSRDVAPDFRSSFSLDKKFTFATFFNVSMPVDRTPQTIEYHNAMIERDRRRREIRNLRMRIVEQVRRAVRQQERLEKTLDVAGAAVEFAEKEVEVATLRYQRGLSNNLDVVNAEGALLAARGRRISILADMAVARLSLRATLGVLDPRKDLLTGAERP